MPALPTYRRARPPSPTSASRRWKSEAMRISSMAVAAAMMVIVIAAGAAAAVLSLRGGGGVGASSGTCPQGTTTDPADGCSGAQATGILLVPNFFTTYTGTDYSSHLPSPRRNVAGVDYPVGYAGTPVDGTVSGNRVPPYVTPSGCL